MYMKNKIKLLVVMVLLSIATHSQAQNRLYTEDFEIAAGETMEIVLSLDNSTVYTAFQADIYLPKGIEITKDEEGYYNIVGSTRIRRHTVEAQFHEEGNFTRIVGYTSNNAKISGSSGELLYIEIEADADFAGTHSLRLSNVRFATPPADDGTIREDLFEEEAVTVSGPAIEEVALHFADTYYSLLTLYTRKGSSEKFKIEASDKYNGIRLLNYNGADVTGQLVDNVFTTPAIESESLLYVEYETSQTGKRAMQAPAGEGVYEEVPLTIIDSEYGSITLYTETGDREKLGIRPFSQQYILNTVLFNGEDVTSQLENDVFTTPYITGASTLSISYTIPTKAEDMTLNSHIKAYGYDGEIVISGCNRNEMITIYSVDGLLLHTEYATTDITRIAMPTDAVYVVKVCDTAVKVAL